MAFEFYYQLQIIFNPENQQLPLASVSSEGILLSV
jgi:hypothetical protein